MKTIKEKRKKIVNIIILVIFMINCAFIKNVYGEENISYNENMSKVFEDIEAPNILLGNTENGEILYGKAIEEKVYPASLTKLMTALLVIENCELDEIVTVSEKAVKSVPSGYVNANLQVGEELTVEDLLYSMLVPSANDAANALAEYVGGNIESFATMMNTRAKELGCTGTNFTNPSGLHEEKHVSTAKDLFLIANEIVKNPIIKKMIGTIRYTLPQTNKYVGEPRIFITTNYLISPNLSKFYTEDCIGGKTGYTEYAKNCVIEFTERNNIKLTVVILGANAKVKGQKFLDVRKMSEYIFENYYIKEIVKENEEYKNIEIKNATQKTKNLSVLCKKSISILMENGNENCEESEEYIKSKSPIEKNEIVGKVIYKYNNREYSTELIAGENVKKSYMNCIIIIILIIIFIVYLLKKSNRNIGNHGRNI